ncbi:MAG: hypothetical protein AAF479_12505 [Pseudomonadota bacterium]
MPITIREDTGNLYNWDRIEQNYETVGGVRTLTHRLTVYDDGVTKSESFDDTGSWLVYTNTSSVVGTGSWKKIEIRFNSSGERESRLTTFDNGVVNSEQYVSGHLSFVEQLDGPQPEFDRDTGDVIQPADTGAFSWQSVGTRFDSDTGAIQVRSTIYDNGVLHDEVFENGVRVQFWQTDGPQPEYDHELGDYVQPEDPGVQVWQWIGTIFDNVTGQILIRSTVYDNGVLHDEQFENGTRISLQQFDGPQPDYDFEIGDFVQPDDPGVRDWQSILTYFNSDTGLIESRGTDYDNGISTIEEYQAGIRTVFRQFDGPQPEYDFELGERVQPEDPGVREWQSIKTGFDPVSGQPQSRTIVYDNDVVYRELYRDGVRINLFQSDGLELEPSDDVLPDDPGVWEWRSIGTIFDHTTGEIVRRTKVYDNGGRKVEEFVEGQLSLLRQTDDTSSPFGSEDWASVETVYENGQLTQRKTTFDNNDERTETFANGRLASIVDSKSSFLGTPPAACTLSLEGCPDSPLGLRAGIDQRVTVFGSDGQVSLRKTLYANDDQTAAIYNDGRIAEQHLLDGDGDRDWLARKLIYGLDGRVSDTLEFYAVAEVPSDFALALDLFEKSADAGELLQTSDDGLPLTAVEPDDPVSFELV